MCQELFYFLIDIELIFYKLRILLQNVVRNHEEQIKQQASHCGRLQRRSAGGSLHDAAS